MPMKHPTTATLTAAEKEIICFVLNKISEVNGVDKGLPDSPMWRMGYIYKELSHQLELMGGHDLFIWTPEKTSDKIEVRKRNSGGAITLLTVLKVVNHD